MATEITSSVPSADTAISSVPSLQNGDRMTQAEFLRRYNAMPHVQHAELVEGRVYMPSPVSAVRHGEPHFDLNGLLFCYRAMTPGVLGGDNSTLKLDTDNAPQPDGYLRIAEEVGGQSKVVNGFIEGAPELILEIAASSVSYDLHEKRNAYRRNGVQEYVVLRTEDSAIDWFVLADGEYKPLPLDDDNIYRSRVFPGLWLDVAATLKGDAKQALDVLHQGIGHESHQAFASSMKPINAQ
ncbi:MAG: Uma2 family endonuclease [Planctomycetales bacterium]|nr:Uma2 family endonuclease [Planctomycetales bacterium]